MYFLFFDWFLSKTISKKIATNSMTYGVAFGLSIIIFSFFYLIYTVLSNKYIDEIKSKMDVKFL